MPRSLSGLRGSTNAGASVDARDPRGRSPRTRSLTELAADDPDLFQKELNRIQSDVAGSREQTRLGAEAVEGSGAPGRAVQAAAVPAAFLSGPVGWGAGALLSLQGLADAYENPNALNVGLGLAGAIPGVRALRGLRGADDAVSNISRNFIRATDDDIARFGVRRQRASIPDSSGPLRRGEFEANDPRFMDLQAPNVSGYRSGTVGQAAGSADEGLRASSYGASASDDVLKGAAQYGDFARRGAAPGGRTSSPYRAGGADDAAAGRARESDDYAEDFINRLNDVDEFEVLDDVTPDQGIPSMEAVDNLIAGMSSVRPARAIRGRQLDSRVADEIADFQQRRRHGVAGFSGLPELSGSELDRITRNIDRIISRR